MNTLIAIITSSAVVGAVVSLVQFFFTRKDKSDERLAGIETKLDKLAATIEDNRAQRKRDKADDARRRILAASDEVLHCVPHSKEWWDQINDDVTEYNKYCTAHPDYRNNKAVHAIDNLDKEYSKKLEINDFL